MVESQELIKPKEQKNMKKHLLILSLLLSYVGAALAQNIDDAKKLMYYERWNSAETNLQKLITSNPDNQEGYYWLTKALLQKKDIPGAKLVQRELQAWLAANPKAKEIPLTKVSSGELLLHEGKRQEAKAIFDQVLKETRSRKPEVMIAIARAYLDVKSADYSYILDLLAKAEKRNKKNAEIFALRGDVYRRLNDGSKAVQAYMEALNKNESHAKASYGMGKIYLTQNNPEMFLKHFNQAITKDPAYAPAYYELFYYYYFRDVNQARQYLDQYIANTDPSFENEYLVTDFLYASSQPQLAIAKAKELLEKEKEKAQPRLFKLIAYSYDAVGDSTQALEYLRQYFSKEADSNYVAKDFELKAKLLAKIQGNGDEVVSSLERALEMDTSATNKAEYAAQLAEIYNKQDDKSNEAKWLGKSYQLRKDPTNLDLYHWGVAHYSAEEYLQADSVFAVYTEKYPEHIHGFYWRAKSNALIDSTMENGLAAPFYQKVIDMAAGDTAENKSLLIQAYGYLGAYHANVKKDFQLALTDFEKILELDPGNDDAVRYREILQKWVNAETAN
jgi:tetratricopeptide (TPR) repeat protein